MKRGFTIVELLVVVVVIAIISTIAVNAYTLSQNRSYDAATRGLAASVKSGAERYYNTNNEYPSAYVLNGGALGGTSTPPFTTISPKIDVPVTNLDGANAKIQPCSGTNAYCGLTAPNNLKVYYLTKTDPPSATAESYTIDGCTYTFPATEVGSASFVIAFWSYKDNRWMVAKGNNGGVTTSNVTTCPFRAL